MIKVYIKYDINMLKNIIISNCRIEWLAYDYHSGIDSIYWRLYDNVTGDEIIHGHEDLFAQGSTQVRAVGVKKYRHKL